MFEDISMVKDILNGGYGHFDKLIEKYERVVYIFIYALIGDTNYSMEICKRTFINVYNDLYKYNINYKLVNWILSMAVKEYNSFLKDNENIKTKNNYLNLLNIEDRCILVLKEIKPALCLNDISEILNMSELSVRKRYRFIIDSYKRENSTARQN